MGRDIASDAAVYGAESHTTGRDAIHRVRAMVVAGRSVDGLTPSGCGRHPGV